MSHEAEWCPLDDVIKTVEWWSGSLHMLCMFHALTLRYFEEVYPKLPHRGKGKKKKLTKLRKSYGKSPAFTSYICFALFCYIYIQVTSVSYLHLYIFLHLKSGYI